MSTAPDRDGPPAKGEATEGTGADTSATHWPFGDPSATGPGTAGPVAEPTPVIPVSESSFRQPPGTALSTHQPAEAGDLASRPEVLAGAAFAGGLAVAMLIRRALN